MEFKIFDLGLVDFHEAWQFQKNIFTCVENESFPLALIFCRHHPVITLGRSASWANILVSVPELKNKGIGVYEVERGGDVTYHGPGQITVYPIFNLEYLKKDIHLFLRQLEEVVIEFLSNFGLEAVRCAGRTGVWIGGQKIASIGVAVRRWITFHGLSINIQEGDLDNFRLIRPCGTDAAMTSLETALAREVDSVDLKEKLAQAFRDTFFNPAMGSCGSLQKEAAVWSR